MGNDYVARKSAKKRKKKERQEVGKDGVARRERRRKKIRRLCQGVCYKTPELTAADKAEPWDQDDTMAGAPAYDSDIEEAERRAQSSRQASTSAAAAAAVAAEAKQPRAAKRARHEKAKNAGKAANGPHSSDPDDADADADGGRKGGGMSTSVRLLDPAALAHNARQAALRKLPPGARPEAATAALDPYPPLLQACMLGCGLVEPTPVQERSWPPALAGRDAEGIAEPGSGKTFAYLLPGLVKLQEAGHSAATSPEGPAMLVVLPTRELALQVAGQCRQLRAVTGLRTVCVFGGAPKEEQVALLCGPRRPHVLVATPGRLLDLVDGGHLALKGHVRYLVLDEADKMLSLGFKAQLDRLRDMMLPEPERAKAAAGGGKGGGKCGKGAAKAAQAAKGGSAPEAGTGGSSGDQAGGRPQVLLFSATMPGEVEEAAGQWLANPEVVRVAAGGANAISRTITQVVQVCAEHKKPDKLLRHLARVKEAAAAAGGRNAPRVLVFANRVKTVRFLAGTLAKAGHKVAQLHGQRSQAERQSAVTDFRSGKVQVLVATDVAARGLDIRGLPYVVNYDFPSRLETYVHRVGRTGRLAAFGHAFSFFTRNLAPLAPPLLELLQAHGQAADPNLVALAEAWRVAEAKLGGGAAAAAALARAGDGTSEDPDGGGSEDGEEEEEEEDKGPSHAEMVLGAADDLMEGLGSQEARAVAALLRKKLAKQQQQAEKEKEKQVQGGQENGKEEEEARPAKKHKKGQEKGAEGKGGEEGGLAASGAPRVVRAGDAQLVPATREQQRAQARVQKEMQQQLAAAAGGAAVPAAPFIPSKRFTGARQGYYFKLGPRGLGYYLDPRQKPPAAAAVAGAGAGAKEGAGKAEGGKEQQGKQQAAGGKAAGAAKQGKEAQWGLPTRNRPLVPIPRPEAFLSDSDEEDGSDGGRGSSGDDSDSGGSGSGGGYDSSGSGEEGGGRRGGDSDSDQEGSDGGGGVDGGIDSDSEDDNDGLPLGGQRAVAKAKHKALPGRLRKKLAKQQGGGQQGKGAGQGQGAADRGQQGGRGRGRGRGRGEGGRGGRGGGRGERGRGGGRGRIPGRGGRGK